MTELRSELKARGLDTKGLKMLLSERLKTALDEEKRKEEGGGDGATPMESTPATQAEEEKKAAAETEDVKIVADGDGRLHCAHSHRHCCLQ